MTRELNELIAAEVLATPGVVRLEPTLRHVVYELTTRLKTARPLRPAVSKTGTDGVTVSVAGTTTVTIDIATSPAPSALTSAALVQSRVLVLLSLRGVANATVNVNVLAVIDAAPEDWVGVR